MIKNWDKYEHKKRDKLKRRIRKGIPDSLRSSAWMAFAGIKAKITEKPNLYRSLLEKESEHSEVISRDIHRTFPEHILFRDDLNGKKGSGRESLFNVLKAYSIYDPEVGYCQGMGFIVGMFLMYMSEEDSFWMLEYLLRNPAFFLNGLYSPGFPLLHQFFFQFEELMKKSLPKLYDHLQKEGVSPQIYATQWFITLFAYNLPFEVVLRLWDILLSEGVKILFRFSIYLMTHYESSFLQMDFAGIVLSLKDMHRQEFIKDPDVLIQSALKVNITSAGLNQLGRTYQQKVFQEKQKGNQKRTRTI